MSRNKLASVTLTDLGNAARFHIAQSGRRGNEARFLVFQLRPAAGNPNQLNQNQLVFSNVTVASNTYQTTLAPTRSPTVNSLKADGHGYYDGKFQYIGSNFLGHGQTLSFDLAVAGHDLAVSDFHLFSLPGGGTGSYLMASHIRNVSGGDSLWVGTNVAVVPLPAASLLFAGGLAGLLGLRRSAA